MAFLRMNRGAFPGRRYELSTGENYIGRDARHSDIVLPHDAVSRRHARLEVTEEGVFVEDLNSHNGTRVNGLRLNKGGGGRRSGRHTATLGLSPGFHAGMDTARNLE